jgi:hypothetical protein
MNEVSPGLLRYVSDLRGPTKSGMISRALSGAAALIEKMEAEQKARLVEAAGIIEFIGQHATELSDENERLRAALKPFAEAAGRIDEWSKASVRPETPSYGVTHDDFRAAATAYEQSMLPKEG